MILILNFLVNKYFGQKWVTTKSLLLFIDNSDFCKIVSNKHITVIEPFHMKPIQLSNTTNWVSGQLC